MDDSEPITRERIDELLAFRPRFEDPQFQPVIAWTPYPDYAADVIAFFDLASQPCWRDTNYVANIAGKQTLDDAAVAAAGLEQIKTMLTFCSRAERFNDGAWAAVLKNGRIVALLKRLQQLRKSVPAGSPPHHA